MDETTWAPAYSLLDAMTADARARELALAPDDGAWWWMTHAIERDGDARELQVHRLRSGLDLLVVHEHRVRVSR